MSYEYTCPDCGKTTCEHTTGDYNFGDEVECPWCGRISTVSNLNIVLSLRVTTKKTSPTKLEELEELKTKRC